MLFYCVLYVFSGFNLISPYVLLALVKRRRIIRRRKLLWWERDAAQGDAVLGSYTALKTVWTSRIIWSRQIHCTSNFHHTKSQFKHTHESYLKIKNQILLFSHFILMCCSTSFALKKLKKIKLDFKNYFLNKIKKFKKKIKFDRKRNGIKIKIAVKNLKEKNSGDKVTDWHFAK